MALLSRCGVGHPSHSRSLLLNLAHFFACCLSIHAAHLFHHVVKLASSPSLQSKKKKGRKEMDTSVVLFMTQWISHGFSLLGLKAVSTLLRKKECFLVRGSSRQPLSSRIECPSSHQLDAFLSLLCGCPINPLFPLPLIPCDKVFFC